MTTPPRSRAPLLLLGIGLLLPGCPDVEEAEEPLVERVVPVSVGTATSKTVVDPVVVTGIVKPLREVVIAAEGSGRVVDLPAQLGRRVARGEELARLDSGVQRAHLDQARAQADQAAAGLELAEAELGRAEGMHQQGASTDRDLQAVTIQVRTARAQLNAAEASVRLAERALADTAIHAPFGGTISVVRIELGALVGPGTPAFGLVDLSSAKIGLGIAGREVSLLAEGQSAAAQIPSLGERGFVGQVTAISPTTDVRTHTWPVEVTVPNPDGELRAGMVARVQIVVGERAGVVVPEGAVVEGDAPVVFVIEGDVAVARLVDLGRSADGEVEILTGVLAGEQVAVLGSQHLSDGVKVSVYAMPDGDAGSSVLPAAQE